MTLTNTLESKYMYELRGRTENGGATSGKDKKDKK